MKETVKCKNQTLKKWKKINKTTKQKQNKRTLRIIVIFWNWYLAITFTSDAC